MKKVSVLLAAALCLVFSSYAESRPDNFLWPVSGDAGQGILFTPQNYIGGELNFGSLFITAPEGAPVLAPADGVIETFQMHYFRSLQYSMSEKIESGKTIDKQLHDFAAEVGAKEPKYANLSIGIRLHDGRMLWISGLRGCRVFSTGEKVIRGEQIGTVGYAYEKIPEPSISLEISDPRERVADPMTPFGLKTTFLPPSEIPTVTTLTGAQAREDFTILTAALREAYPGLYDAVTPAELDTFCTQMLASFPETMSIADFYAAIKRVTGKLHDSHLYLYPMECELQRRSIDLPQLFFGRIDSALVVTRCTAPYAAYYGRRIRAVDGIPADSVCRIAAEYVGGYDAGVRSWMDYALALGASQLYFGYAPGASRNGDMAVEFDDGEQLDLKGWTYRGGELRGFDPDRSAFFDRNIYAGSPYSLRMLDDSTAYVGLSTFGLNQVQQDSLAAFIRTAAGVPNMIVDVRNNSGGEAGVLNRILSFFATEPFVALDGYMKVSKQGHFESFAHCMNYTPEQEPFSDFVPVTGKTGFYSREDSERIFPDSLTHYGGRLYVLINEESRSAATVFPATILRNHRGVIVGRETGTAYHFMNAYKFADIRMPNSWLTVRVPLVRCVFDETQNPRIPYGRGVIPDHEIGLTLDEIASVRGDSILNYTLALIDRREYLCEDPFAVEAAASNGSRLWIIVAAILLGTGIVVVYRRRTRKENP